MSKAQEYLLYSVGSVIFVISVIIGLWGVGWLWNQSIGSFLHASFNYKSENVDAINERRIKQANKCRDAGYGSYTALDDNTYCDTAVKVKS